MQTNKQLIARIRQLEQETYHARKQIEIWNSKEFKEQEYELWYKRNFNINEIPPRVVYVCATDIQSAGEWAEELEREGFMPVVPQLCFAYLQGSNKEMQFRKILMSRCNALIYRESVINETMLEEINFAKSIKLDIIRRD